MTKVARQPDAPSEPYCGSCGYVLIGLTESSRCPECGKPLIDVLVRPGFTAPRGKRYRSKATLFGLPIIDIAFGPSDAELKGRARGIIAIGDDAMGWLAVGGVARGIVAVGGFAMGGFAIGGAAIGLGTALGGTALGGLAVGGGAIGGLAHGGCTAGVVAQGGAAIGWAAKGGGVRGVHTLGPMQPPSPRAQEIFDGLAWYFGSAFPAFSSLLYPAMLLAVITLAVSAAIGLIALGGLGRKDHDTQSRDLSR